MNGPAFTAMLTVGVSIFQKPNALAGIERERADVEREAATVTDLRRVSAEVSMIEGWLRQKRLASNAEILLLYSDTTMGELASVGVETVLKKHHDFQVSRKRIPGLDMTTAHQAVRGMQQYLVDLAETLQSYEPGITLFAPIGGYKSIVSLAYPLASLYGHDAWYLFEGGNDPVALPRLPIRFDEATLSRPDHVRHLRKFAYQAGLSLNEPLEFDRLPVELRSWIEQHPAYFYRYENLVGLSPLLVLELKKRPLLYMPRVRLPKRLETQRRTMQGILKDFGQYYGLHLRKPSAFTNKLFRHELDWSDRDFTDSPYSIYRMSGSPQHRAVYRWVEEDGEMILVFKTVWFNYAEYERDRKKIETVMREEEKAGNQFVEIDEWKGVE